MGEGLERGGLGLGGGRGGKVIRGGCGRRKRGNGGGGGVVIGGREMGGLILRLWGGVLKGGRI